MDKYFTFMTGMPLGYILCSSEKTELLTDARSVFKELLPRCAWKWKGRGKKGPSIFVTDDCLAEQTAIQMSGHPVPTSSVNFIFFKLSGGGSGVPTTKFAKMIVQKSNIASVKFYMQ